MTPTPKSLQIPGGPRLEYVEQGDPDGIPVVMLHGVTDSWHSFAPVLPHLPTTIHAFALSQRGHGDSEKPPAGYRTRDFANDVAGFVDALGLAPAVVVGHSMGTTHALRFAIDHPGRVRGLVLVAAFSEYIQDSAAGDFRRSVVSQLEDPIDPEVAIEFQASTIEQPISSEFMDLVVGESLKVPARVWRGAFEGFFENDFVQELGRISAPTLLLWGDADAFCTRGDQDALLEAIPHARLVAYAGVGHALHWEQPERFAAELAAFVSDVTG